MSAPSGRNLQISLRTARGRSAASQRWLERQLNDPYVQAARREGWRSRAAFKLMELDDRFHLVRKGARVVDLGAAPGGWSQVAVKRGARVVVSLDSLRFDPIAGVQALQGDFTAPETLQLLGMALRDKADLVLSDMAPNTTGHATTDHIRIMALAGLALDLARTILVRGGSFVCKVLQGGAEREMLAILRRDFTEVRHAKPKASRSDSRELYVVAMGFRGSS